MKKCAKAAWLWSRLFFSLKPSSFLFGRSRERSTTVPILSIFNEDRQKWSEKRWNFILKDDQRSLNLNDEFEKISEEEIFVVFRQWIIGENAENFIDLLLTVFSWSTFWKSSLSASFQQFDEEFPYRQSEDKNFCTSSFCQIRSVSMEFSFDKWRRNDKRQSNREGGEAISGENFIFQTKKSHHSTIVKMFFLCISTRSTHCRKGEVCRVNLFKPMMCLMTKFQFVPMSTLNLFDENWSNVFSFPFEKKYFESLFWFERWNRLIRSLLCTRTSIIIVPCS